MTTKQETADAVVAAEAVAADAVAAAEAPERDRPQAGGGGGDGLGRHGALRVHHEAALQGGNSMDSGRVLQSFSGHIWECVWAIFPLY